MKPSVPPSAAPGESARRRRAASPGGVSYILNKYTVGEAGSATGVSAATPITADNTAPSSGAVYLFTRSGGTWRRQAYLKASNTGREDWFGTSTALSGGRLAVGALYEESSATGVNGDQTNNSASQSGAVYVRRIAP